MPVTRRRRQIAAPPDRIWDVIADPYHLPRWWPRVTRVEGVEGTAFTQVLTTKRGRPVRADFRVLVSESQRRCVWAQELDGTPFARVLSVAETELLLEPAAGSAPATHVTLELRQTLQGNLSRLGGFMVRRATRKLLDQALDGLEAIVG